MSALCEPLQATLNGANGYSGTLHGLQLSSHFQPIFSLAHRRPIGHEALMRVSDQGQVINPLELFARCPDFTARLQLLRMVNQWLQRPEAPRKLRVR